MYKLVKHLLNKLLPASLSSWCICHMNLLKYFIASEKHNIKICKWIQLFYNCKQSELQETGRYTQIYAYAATVADSQQFQ